MPDSPKALLHSARQIVEALSEGLNLVQEECRAILMRGTHCDVNDSRPHSIHGGGFEQVDGKSDVGFCGLHQQLHPCQGFADAYDCL